MSNVSGDKLYRTSANEPVIHPLIRRSPLFVPTAGMRLAPEVLVVELFREVFFKPHFGAKSGKDLDPEEKNGSFYYSTAERAVLYMLRGRRRKSKNAKSKPFFAPAYPTLARNCWLGKNRERVIVNFLLGGAVAQYLWHKGETEEKRREHEELATRLLAALEGQKSYQGEDVHGKDILSVTLRSSIPVVDHEIAKENLLSKTRPETVFDLTEDNISQRVTRDLLALCDLEKRLPRMQWLQILMTFLRFALPVWLLAHMRVTSLLHGWLIAAIDNDELASPEQIETGIIRRNQKLLQPTLTANREIFEHTETYMKRRVELSILLYLLEKVRPKQISDKRLKIQGAGAKVMRIDQLLLLAREAVEDMKTTPWFTKVAGTGRFQDFLTREAEESAAWRDPLNKGQGKNIDEFFRVLYRDDLGDEAGGYLLVPEGRGRTRGFRVFPGQLLLKAITFLAAREKQTSCTIRGGGRLVLEDVESHFQQYGIDFSSAAASRPLLMRELLAMGLLTGSPDAGSSVAVACPY